MNITVQSHQQSKSLPRTGSDQKEDPTIPGYVQLRRIEAIDYWPLVCMEEGNQPGDLAISCGHGNAQEEYAMRRRRRI